MDIADRIAFDHQDREDIYGYVESHGNVRPETVRRALGIEERAFGHHVAILKRDGILEASDGRLGVAFESGTEETVETDGLSVTIRRAREEDLTGLVGAIRAAIGDGEYVEAESIADVVDSEGVLLRHNDLESRIFFVATVDDEVVGWTHLKHPELEKLDHTAELTVGVLDAYRNHGIGTRLLDRSLAWARSQGLERIYNSVPSTNRTAIEFLAARGWEEEACRHDHYKIDGEYVDEIMMAKEL